MDMNRKKMQMTASLMLKFVIVIFTFVMMSTTANAGAFLTDGGVAHNSITINGENYTVINRSRSDSNTNTHSNSNIADDKDLWYDGPYEDPGPHEYDTYLDYDSLYNDGIGYTYNDDLGSEDYTGYYIGTFGENESQTDLENLIQYFFGFPEIEFLGYAKYDLPGTDQDGNEVPEEWFSDEYELTVTIDDYDDNDDPKNGTWKVTNNQNENEAISFYSVKGAKEYALYYVDPAESQGFWTTAHLLTGTENSGSRNQPSISHFSVMRTTFETEDPNVPPGAVPEPATMLLFGFSLMGLAGIARRKNSKF